MASVAYRTETDTIKEANNNQGDYGSGLEMGGGHPSGVVVMIPQMVLQLGPNCPPGLEAFLNQETLHMQFTTDCCDNGIRFDILNSENQLLLKSKQVPDGCCGKGFKMAVKTLNKAPVVSARYEIGCCGCCDMGLRVEAPPGNLIGYVAFQPDEKCCECESSAKCSCGSCCPRLICCPDLTVPVLFLMNPDRRVELTINVDFTTTCRCCSRFTDRLAKLMQLCPPHDDFYYSLRANNGREIGVGDQIGSVCKKYPGCLCPDPDRYSLNMPADLDIRMKTLVMCSVFLMKYLKW